MQLASDTQALPWAPVAPGYSFKALHASPDAPEWVLLLRFEPGTVVPRHRHTGEVHAYTLTGQRKLLDTGEVVAAGGYVYEAPGNVDTWMAVGDEPLIAFVTVRGAVEYLDEHGEVARRTTAATSYEHYQRFLASRQETASHSGS
jgi:2,4'-dihydroxyacetophenone dioxygenase